MSTRVYAVVDANVNPFLADAQWRTLFAQVAATEQSVAQAIVQAAHAAHNHITTHKRTQGAGLENRATMLGFEVDTQHVSAIIAIVNQQAALRGIVEATNAARFGAVLEAEIQDAATALGHTAQNITINRWTHADRATAIAQAQNYLRDNAHIWYA